MGSGMTLTQAAKIWAEEKRRRDETGPAFEEARRVLIEHFRESGKAEYASKGGRIGYARSIRKVLDSAAVKKFLGARLGKYQRDTEVESLSLLE
jgi:hypothetical protein